MTVLPEATVYATARNTEGDNDLQELAKKYRSRVDIVQLDMLDEQSVTACHLSLGLFLAAHLHYLMSSQKAAEYLRTVTSHLDLAIYNAGVALGMGSLPDLTSRDLLNNFKTNVVGPHNLFKVFSPLVDGSQSDRKSIAVISSIAGSIGTLPELVPAVKQMFKLDYSPIGGYSVTKSVLKDNLEEVRLICPFQVWSKYAR